MVRFSLGEGNPTAGAVGRVGLLGLSPVIEGGEDAIQGRDVVATAEAASDVLTESGDLVALGGLLTFGALFEHNLKVLDRKSVV